MTYLPFIIQISNNTENVFNLIDVSALFVFQLMRT